MIQYIASFIVYTLAMVGVLVIGFVVYKKTVMNSPLKSNSLLKIEDMMRLPDRKVLYVINCKGEQFLIASSNDNVNLISRLDNRRRANEEDIEKYLQEKSFEETHFDDEKYFGSKQTKGNKRHILKSLLKELSDKNKTKRGNY